jgi:hypothetical protein
VRVILAHPLVLRSRGYYVADLNGWDFGPSTRARVRWLKVEIAGVPDFSEEALAEIQLGTQDGWLAVVSGEER